METAPGTCKTAEGTFEITMTPAPIDDGLGRFLLTKTYAGDLVGTARGQMLAYSSTVEGSAAYVALELFSGSIGKRSGTFALHHRGVMDRGAPSLTVSVVPDSGTADLAGIAGELEIIVANGTHSYVFTYELEV
jgi:Protein of unknown function (DUF3224)